ncbi:iron chaperone [Amycolatopsis sp. NPDC059021]|uniref:iron chaperone n=1 Tax=Amycolatopsis sp. NPDC059021 TaxID=3346704 RepID=UPI003671FEE3
MAMQGKSTAATHEEYLSALAEPRQGELRALHELIRATVPELAPTMEFGMPGYGRYHYRYASGREGDWALVMLASNKNYISLYVAAVVGERYLAESYADRLPEASVGKSCVRFKRLSDVDTGVLAELFTVAAAHPPGELAQGPNMP